MAHSPPSKAGVGPSPIPWAVRVNPQNELLQAHIEMLHVLEPGFANWMEEVDATQPCYAVVVDGQAVSVCRTVRRSGRGIEAGIDTLEGYRRKGYAKRAVAAWCRAARQEGMIGFYSTSWSNAASRALADSVGLRQFAVEFSVS